MPDPYHGRLEYRRSATNGSSEKPRAFPPYQFDRRVAYTYGSDPVQKKSLIELYLYIPFENACLISIVTMNPGTIYEDIS